MPGLPAKAKKWALIFIAVATPMPGRAITGLPTLARFAPRPLVLDLADQVSTHLPEGMIKVALVGGGHEVRPSRYPGLKGDPSSLSPSANCVIGNVTFSRSKAGVRHPTKLGTHI